MISMVKIQISSEANSTAAQEFLFENGCRWGTQGNSTPHVLEKCGMRYLYVNVNGVITWGDTKETFDRSPYREIQLKPTYEVVDVPPESILIDGSWYVKSEALNALRCVKRLEAEQNEYHKS